MSECDATLRSVVGKRQFKKVTVLSLSWAGCKAVDLLLSYPTLNPCDNLPADAAIVLPISVKLESGRFLLLNSKLGAAKLIQKNVDLLLKAVAEHYGGRNVDKRVAGHRAGAESPGTGLRTLLAAKSAAVLPAGCLNG